METTTSTFLFRDHRDTDHSSVSGDGSDDISSVHTHDDVDGEDDDFQSMTAMGIKHLCSELMELKEESDEDFYRTIFSDYSVFIRIFEDVEVMEHEMSQLKSHVSDQRKLVDDLMDGLRENLSMDEVNKPWDDDNDDDEDELIYMSELDAHVVEVSETLDILLVENRVDEALDVLEKENENLRKMEEENKCLPDTFRAVKSLILEMEATLALQLTVVAENPRISASELQTTLAHLKRLGNDSLVNQLLFKYYHRRIAAATRRLESLSLSFHYGLYIRDLSKLVFSLIAQATKGFEMLNGDDSANTRELTQWAKEETDAFARIFSAYAKSISEINGGLLTAVQCMEFTLSFCSLQRIDLRNRLVNGISPCMEETLQIHIEHYKKVVRLFTASDGWILGKYLISGILASGDSTAADGEYPEYCYLTNSGRKLVTLLQSITEDVSPLLVLRMRNSIVKGLKDLYKAYVALSKEAVTCDRCQKGDPEVDSPETLTHQVSVLANVSTLADLFCRMITSNFHGDGFDSCLSHVVEASDLLRSCFCQDFLSRVMSLGSDHLCSTKIQDDERSSGGCSGPMMPSPPFQVLFLEFRKIERLSEEEVFQKSWLLELLKELVEAAFAWLQSISTNSDSDDYVHNLALQYRESPDQFAVDFRFLAEIAKHGGYFSNDPSVLVSLSNSPQISADPDLQRDLVRGKEAAAEAIRRLLEFEEEENKNQLHTRATSDSDCIEDVETDEADSRNVITTSIKEEESSVITDDDDDDVVKDFQS